MKKDPASCSAARPGGNTRETDQALTGGHRSTETPEVTGTSPVSIPLWGCLVGAHLAGGPSQLVSKSWLNIQPVSRRRDVPRRVAPAPAPLTAAPRSPQSRSSACHGVLRSAELHKADESLVLSRSSAVLACLVPGTACHPFPCPRRSLPAPHHSGSTAAPAPKV